jgi:hypothetical protein
LVLNGQKPIQFLDLSLHFCTIGAKLQHLRGPFFTLCCSGTGHVLQGAQSLFDRLPQVEYFNFVQGTMKTR